MKGCITERVILNKALKHQVSFLCHIQEFWEQYPSRESRIFKGMEEGDSEVVRVSELEASYQDLWGRSLS